MGVQMNPVMLNGPYRGRDGNTIFSIARDPLMTDGRIGDFCINTVSKHLFGPKNAGAWPDRGMIKGDEGWAPVLSVTTDGARRVFKVTDWQGGSGDKPVTGLYVAASGLTSVLADAIDIRGPQGPEALITALNSKTTPVTYDTLMALAETGDDNEKISVSRMFEPASTILAASKVAAQAMTVPASISHLYTPDREFLRVDSEPTVINAADKLRTLDRFTSTGTSDSANGGWWQARFWKTVGSSAGTVAAGDDPRIVAAIPYGEVDDGALASPSKIANRRDDIIDIRDWNGAGSVTGGGSGSIFTDALTAAYEELEGTGSRINIPPSPNGLPYMCGKVTFGDRLAETQSKLIFDGAEFVQVQPAEPVPNGGALWTISGTFFGMERITFLDPNNLLEIPEDPSDPSGGAFVYTNVPRTGLPIRLKKIIGLGGAVLLRNDYADNVKYRDIQTLNTRTILHNNSGGVGGRIEGVRGQGCKFGIVLDSDVATDALRTHAEGFSIADAELLVTQENGVGLLVFDVLKLAMSDVVIGQCGTGTVGAYLNGTLSGKPISIVEGNRVWFEGGTGAPALKSRGNVSNVKFEKLTLSFGGTATNITGIDYEDVNGFSFSDGLTHDPDGTHIAVAASIKNSIGVVNDCRWDKGTISEDSTCQVIWNTDYSPSTGQSLLSQYPRAAWRSYTPTVSAASGTITASSAIGKFKRSGKSVTAVIQATITTNGTGSAALLLGLPYQVKTSPLPYIGSGREDAVTGNMLQVRAPTGATSCVVLTTNNAYPAANGSVIQVQIEYEIA